MHLRYGLNPTQPASLTPVTDPPFRVLAGQPSYINILDALTGWQLVRTADAVLGRAAAASFKHVSPAGAALSGPIDSVIAEEHGLSGTVGPLASAYLRARDADPRASYGDFVAVSRPVDAQLAGLLRSVVSDGVIAPGYEPGTVATLSAKKGGRYLVLGADPAYEPPRQESRDVFGVRLTQDRADGLPSPAQLCAAAAGPLPDPVLEDALLGMIVLRSTQSNSVAYVRSGMTLGIGAGQQSRIDCTVLAGRKADAWALRRHPRVRGLTFARQVRRQDRTNWRLRYLEGDLTADERRLFEAAVPDPPAGLDRAERRAWLSEQDGVCFVSDGALPFRDNVDRAARHGVRYVVEPGGSVRSGAVAAACAEQGITLVRTGVRLFHH